MGELPAWTEGSPPSPGLYVTVSTHPERKPIPQVAYWDGKIWQHWSGWFDHAITHWMPSDFPEKGCAALAEAG